MASVYNPDFISNEAWIGFPTSEHWVEAGAASGTGGSNEGPTPPFWRGGLYYFTAHGDGPKHYYEQDYPETGPGNSLFGVDIHYVPSDGRWHMITGPILAGVWKGEPSSGTRAEVGMEETNNNIVNWGTAYYLSWWSAQNGVLYKGWFWNQYHDKLYQQAGLTCGNLRGGYEEFYWQANGGPC